MHCLKVILQSKQTKQFSIRSKKFLIYPLVWPQEGPKVAHVGPWSLLCFNKNWVLALLFCMVLNLLITQPKLALVKPTWVEGFLGNPQRCSKITKKYIFRDRTNNAKLKTLYYQKHFFRSCFRQPISWLPSWQSRVLSHLCWKKSLGSLQWFLAGLPNRCWRRRVDICK